MPDSQIISLLNSSHSSFDDLLNKLLAVPEEKQAMLESQVSKIIADVKLRGDDALLEYTARFDRYCLQNPASLEISLKDEEYKWRLKDFPDDLYRVIESAASRIRSFHEKQKAQLGCSNWQYQENNGNILGYRSSPLDRVGVYVPGGLAAYPSSVLMNAIPARVAGVKEIIMVVPMPDGQLNPAVLVAAKLAGVDRLFSLGGAQAIAALTFGTKTIPAVDKIVGPGNAYVACAKRQVFGRVGIDMVAGPSEVLIICDDNANPEWVATDMCAQAEHDVSAQAIVLTPSVKMIKSIEQKLKEIVPKFPRAAIITQALKERGGLIKVANLDEACSLANSIAPEHLELNVKNPELLLEKIRHAGAIFVGEYSSESLGDYCAGPNHVLPTSTSARFSSGLGVDDFVKRSSLLQVSPIGAVQLGEIAGKLATAEGLQAHAKSATSRVDYLKHKDPALNELLDAAQSSLRTFDGLAFRQDVLDMKAYPVIKSSGLIKLDAMENPFSLPKELKMILASRLVETELNRYPEVNSSSLVEGLRVEFGLDKGSDVLFGNGSDELISLLCQVTASGENTVLTVAPSFVMYRISSKIARQNFMEIPLVRSAIDDFSLDVDRLLACIREKSPSVIFLSNPNNPTGTLFDDQSIRTIIEGAPHSLVVLDEAYFPFSRKTWIDSLPEYSNLVVLRTFSKVGLAGIRFGCLMASRDVIAQIDKIRPPYNVNTLTQVCMRFVLDNISVFKEQVNQIIQERQKMKSALAKLNLKAFKSEANFLTFELPQNIHASEVYSRLYQSGILVKDVSAHPMLANCLRVTIGTQDENAVFMKHLSHIIASY